MKVLAFDLSTHTGFGVLEMTDEDIRLINYGLIDIKVPNYKADVSHWSEFQDIFPHNFIAVAETIAKECYKIALKYPDARIVTEMTEGSSHRISQRLLEFIHFAIFKKFGRHGLEIRYLNNSDWRDAVGCYIKYHPALDKYNKQVSRAKKKAKPTRSGAKVAKIDGKIVTRYDAKKLSIKIANDKFGLQLKNDNISDAILLGLASFTIPGFWLK